MISRLQALLFLIFVGASFALDFSFQANVNISVSPTTNGWQYRRLFMKGWNTQVSQGVSYVSVAVQKSAGATSVDAIGGAAYVTLGGHPIHYIAYFGSQSDFSLNTDSGASFATFTNLSAAAGYIGSAYLYLVETNPSGAIVARQSLKSSLVVTPGNGVNWGISDHSSISANLKYLTFSASASNSATIDVSFIGSAVVGVLNQSSTVVGPKSFESVIQIQNWAYQSPNNSLSLLIGVATGAATLSANGQTLITVNGTNQVYYSMRKDAYVNGKFVNAQLSFALNSTANIEDADFFAQVTAKYGGSATFRIAAVTFPPGASNIIYDPSVGAGAPMDDVATGSTTSFAIRAPTITLAMVLVVILSLLL